MEEAAVLGLMTISGLGPMALMTWLTKSGQVGWALTAMSVLGAVFTILIYAASRPIGIDPLQAISFALLFCLPALMGGAAGALLGWVLRRSREK